MVVSSWTYRSVLSYFLARCGRPVAPYVVSAMIGEGIQAVEQACNDLAQAGLLTKLASDDTSHVRFQLIDPQVEAARTALTRGIIRPE